MAPACENFPITVPVLALDDTVLADRIFINITPRNNPWPLPHLESQSRLADDPLVTLPLEEANVQFMTVVATKMPYIGRG
jgi:hypothetical protein